MEVTTKDSGLESLTLREVAGTLRIVDLERQAIAEALAVGRNLTAAARLLGIHRDTLRARMQFYKMSVPTSPAESVSEPATRATVRLLTSPDSHIQLTMVELGRPGACIMPHQHRRPAAFYALAGEGVAHVGQESKPIHEGETVCIPARTLHWVEPSGTSRLRLLVVNILAPELDEDAYGLPADGLPKLLRKTATGFYKKSAATNEK